MPYGLDHNPLLSPRPLTQSTPPSLLLRGSATEPCIAIPASMVVSPEVGMVGLIVAAPSLVLIIEEDRIAIDRASRDIK